MSTDPGAPAVGPLVVGYLATESGDDGVALAIALARASGAPIELVCVVRPIQDDGQPGLAGYLKRVEDQAAQWLAEGAERIPEDIPTTTTVTLHESFAEALIGLAEDRGASMIVVGGAGDGLLSRHTLGTVSTALLHSSPMPVALAPRGYSGREQPAIDMITVAVPVRAGRSNPLPFAVAMAEVTKIDLRLMSLVSLHDDHPDDDTGRQARARQVETARTLLDQTRESVGSDLTVEVVVADGKTVDNALDNLTWDDGDIVAVGSGHLGRSARVFLGSTAARILRRTTAPLIVVPRDDEPESSGE